VKIASLLLLFVPVAVVLEYLAPGQHLWIFLASALAIVPCAGWMGKATEELATRTGEGIGGLLNATVEPAAHALGMNSVFVGIFVVAILGNAAEHATAVTAALGNRMELALGIAVGSSVQIALFVTPVLVLASLGFGPQPMDLVFFPGLVLTVFFAVLVLGQVSGDGQSNWIKGVQLLAVYLILAIVFYFAPGKASQ
jgi:Ca2+:H+ antiporter